MLCAGCNKEFEIGDIYIEDTVSGFLNDAGSNTEINDIIAEIFGADDGKVRFCEDCTQPGGNYKFETYYGDELED